MFKKESGASLFFESLRKFLLKLSEPVLVEKRTVFFFFFKLNPWLLGIIPWLFFLELFLLSDVFFCMLFQSGSALTRAYLAGGGVGGSCRWMGTTMINITTLLCVSVDTRYIVTIFLTR